MAKEIIWTHPVSGLTHITIPSDNVYVPVGVSPLKPSDFKTYDGIVEGETCDKIVFATDKEEAHIEKATMRLATPEEIAERDLPLFLAWEGIIDPVEYHVVERTASMSMDNYFRDAWVHEEGALSVNMEKAVEIHKQRLREKRAYELVDLDLKQLRHIGAGNIEGAKALEARKQELRDITKHPDIQAAQTPEELKFAAVKVLEG